jgi:type II secretory pathway component PulF
MEHGHVILLYRRDPLGHTHEGSIDADGSDEAVQKLGRDGFQVVKITEEEDGFNLFPPVQRRHCLYDSRLAIMVETGINRRRGRELARAGGQPDAEASSGRPQKTWKGEDFSAALAKHLHFDSTSSHCLASERTGKLGTMLGKSPTTYEADNHSKVKSAMAYPGIMAVLAVE